jgi:hypothetical protein
MFEVIGNSIKCLQYSPKYIFICHQYSWVPHAPFVGRFSHLKLPFYPYKQYATAASIIREYQVDILNHLRGKYRNGELAQDSFGYILMEFGGLHQLTEEEYLSEILVFIVAGKANSSIIMVMHKLT